MKTHRAQDSNRYAWVPIMTTGRYNRHIVAQGLADRLRFPGKSVRIGVRISRVMPTCIIMVRRGSEVCEFEPVIYVAEW
jgi:hypothetical protein